ncbi:GntR family transcriptional regulator [Streptomyces sp. NPDC001940]
MPGRTALYRLYDADDRLLYIGITADLETRFASHSVYKSWWSQVTRKEVTWLPGSRRDVLEVEADAIRREQPKHNGKHNAPRAPFSPDAWPAIDAPPRGKAQALAALIRGEIASGRWAAGVRVPSPKDIASASGVSESTANLAYRYLKNEDVLEFRHGRGIFVA